MAEKVGDIYYEIEAETSQLISAQKQVNKSVGQIGSDLEKTSKSADKFQSSLNKVGAAIAAAFTVEAAKRLLDIADKMNILQARIARLSPSIEVARQTMASLSEISSQTGSSLSDTERLWESLTSALKETGATNGQIVALTSTLQKIGTIGGSSAEEMSNALRQFGQSIAGGVVRAEEFNSILEQMPELARQIASGMGVSIGDLRKRMLEGKLTAEDALNAIQKQSSLVSAEFAKMPRTMQQASNSLEISFQTFIKSINDATGASQTMVMIVDSLTQALDRLMGKSASASQQISDLTSTSEMFERRARTWSWLGLDGWEAQNKALAGLSNKAAALVSDMDAVSKATTIAANTKPISIPTPVDDKKSKAAADKAAKQAESITQKLSEMRKESELAASSTEELSRAQAVLNAQQSLGKGATQEQINQAGEYAAKKWDTANALKAQAAAEKLLPESRENSSYSQDVKDLNTALAAKKISQEQYNATSEQLEQQHQANLAKIRADQAVTPQQAAAGSIDPVQALANENAQKLALIQQFEQQKILTEQQSLALRNSLNTQYEQQRTAAMWQMWRNQSTGNEAVAASFEALAGNASNAFTGILTGSMSASDAMRSLGSTVLNSLINTFVQMGVEWVKSAIMGSAAQTTAIATTTAASVAGTATTTAASTAAAATTVAAWTPAAIVASIGSFGGAAAIGIGAVLGALAMGVAGKRKNGGPVSAGSMYQVGEGGMPEIYQASSGKQYMIPGDNGSVVSNKDMQGTGGKGLNVVVNFNDHTTGGHNYDYQASQNGNTLTIDAFVTDISNGGPMSQSISTYHNAPRKARGG